MSDLLQTISQTILNEAFSGLFQPYNSFIKYLLGLVIFVIFLHKWSSSSSSSSSGTGLPPPPSPPKLPIIGNLHQLGLLLHRSLQTLAQRYGPDLMLLHLGSRPVLVVSSAAAASQILKTHDVAFSSRPKLIFFEKLIYNYRDIVSAPYGEYWRQVRSICVMNLLSNKSVRSFRPVRLEETKLLMKTIQDSCASSSALNLSELFLKLSNDIVTRAAFGWKSSDRGEGQRNMYMDLTIEMPKFFTRVNIGDYIPWLSWYTRLSGLDAQLDSLAKRLDAFFDMVVQEHIDTTSSSNTGSNYENEEAKDLVDILLSIQKENEGSFLDRVCIKAIILDMFVAGTDTTFTSLEWGMSELIRNPRVMRKLQKEVREVVGNKTEISEDDLIRMHYLKAVIKETFRLHPPLPLLVPRSSNQDVNVNGYSIKSNTHVIVNAWAIGRDPKSYTNPEQYNPERFLHRDIDYKGNDCELIPFGSGRRGCPGIQFSTIIGELVLANIVHKFDWALPNGGRGEDLDMSECPGLVAHRKYPLKVIATLF